MYVPLYMLRGRSCEQRRRAHAQLRGPGSTTVQKPSGPKDSAATRRLHRGDLVARLCQCGALKV